jgi:hypothetical protein
MKSGDRQPKPKCVNHPKVDARMIVDVHATVTIIGVLLCTRCGNKMLRDHPASSGVPLREYEESY